MGCSLPMKPTYQEVHREADRLKRLVNDLQELSRVEAKAYELHPAAYLSLYAGRNPGETPGNAIF